MVDYVPLHVEGIPKSKISAFENFTNRHGIKVIKDSIRPEEPEGNYFSANIVAKRGYEGEVIKGLVGPAYAREVHIVEKPSKFDYNIKGD